MIGYRMNEKLEELEMKIAFLERANIELSDMLYQQKRELDALRTHVSGLAARFDEAQTHERPYTQEEEKPPHY
jgi:SlyX protein